MPPLIALLASSSVEVQRAAAGALCNLAGNSTNAGPTCIIMRRTFACCAGEVETQIAASGAIAPLIALLASPSSEIQLAAAWALRNLAENGAPCNACHGGLFVLPRVVAHEHRVSSCAADQNKILIELAGAVPPLVSLLKSPSVALQRPAAEALNALASSGVCDHADASSMLVRLVQPVQQQHVAPRRHCQDLHCCRWCCASDHCNVLVTIDRTASRGCMVAEEPGCEWHARC